MAEVIGQKEKIPAGGEPTGTNRQKQDSLTGILSTAAGATLMLVAFTFTSNPTLQLLAVSVGGLLIGGLR